jgi:hypothetical protein
VHSGSERRGELAALAARTSAYGGSPACVFVCACQLLPGSPQPKNKLGSHSDTGASGSHCNIDYR